MSLFNSVSTHVYAVVRSDRFFITTLALFIVSALWIAITSLYPMAFDEEFHYGLIQIYASSWLPYGIEHTSDMAQFGSATADPSYLFHYLMSFPYRIMNAIGFSDIAIIILLRSINIGFVVAGIILIRRAFKRADVSTAISNVGLLLFMLIPIVVMLSGQINYDNLLFLVIALCTLLVITITNKAIRFHQLPALRTVLLVITLLYGMSIKYAFLPIALGFGLWLIGLTVYILRSSGTSLMTQFINLLKAIGQFSLKIKVLLATIGLLGVFFAADYAVNLVQYGDPIPDCAAVFDDEACKAYGPWNRNRIYSNSLSDSFKPLSYPAYMVVEWVPGMAQRLTFAVAGKTNDFQTKTPLLLVLIGFITGTILGVACLAIQLIRRRQSVSMVAWLALLLMVTYVVVLSLQLYGDYARTGQPVAINGRYLLPLLPMFGVALLQAVANIFKSTPRPRLAVIMAGYLAFLLLGGAGVSTYIVRSESHWFWPGPAQDFHQVLQAPFKQLVVLEEVF